MAIAPPLTITQAFCNDAVFDQMLTRIGLGPDEINRLHTDGFTNMEILTLQYKTNIKLFQDYFSNTNKTFGSARVVLQVYFTPVVVTRLLGILHFCE